jgi:hypothetical protein
VAVAVADDIDAAGEADRLAIGVAPQLTSTVARKT